MVLLSAGFGLTDADNVTRLTYCPDLEDCHVKILTPKVKHKGKRFSC